MRHSAAEVSRKLLGSGAQRSDAATKVADEMRASRTRLNNEQLRGLDVSTLVAGGARLFADGGQAARDDPRGVFALSSPVQRLDYFVSHSWKSPRLAKYAALLSFFNLNAAIIAFAVACFACFWFSTLYFEMLPDWMVMEGQGKYFDDVALRCCAFAQLLAPLAFTIVAFFGHHVFCRGEKAFLDIACIDQNDATSKRSGINSLGALLDRSQRMIVLLDEVRPRAARRRARATTTSLEPALSNPVTALHDAHVVRLRVGGVRQARFAQSHGHRSAPHLDADRRPFGLVVPLPIPHHFQHKQLIR